MRLTRQLISDATAFDRGDKFASAEQVRDYFTVAEQERMFGESQDQATLDDMADAVIDNGWHIEITVTLSYSDAEAVADALDVASLDGEDDLLVEFANLIRNRMATTKEAS